MDNVINAKTIPEGTANILELDEPQNYRCVVHELGSTRAGLRLDLDYLGEDEAQDSTVYVFLQNLLYFEGSLEWVSANVQMGTDESLAQLFSNIRKGNPHNPVNGNNIPGDFKLYEIHTAGVTIRIIAGTTVVISSTPRMFET